MIQQVIAKITELQPKEENNVWMVGEQLKDIARTREKDAEILLQDLDVPEMSLVNAEKEIKKYADSNKKGNSASVSFHMAEKILRKFYGLTPLEEIQRLKETTVQETSSSKEKSSVSTSPNEQKTAAISVDLDDFL